jgi:CubicO group peptidase (beta-lactamase class C family)
MKNILLLFLCLPFFAIAQRTPTTPQEKAVDEKAQLVKNYFNKKDIDSLYTLLAPSFKKQVSIEVLKNGMVDQLGPYGTIVDFDFVNQKNGISKYKTLFSAGITLQTIIQLDEEGLINTLAMQPYKDEDAPKRKNLYNDNALKTAFDSAVDKAARSYMMDTATKGLSVGMYYNNQQYFYNYGEANKAGDVKASTETVYEIGSITKTFAGNLLAKAVKKGLIQLNDPITKYLPDSVAANPALQKIKIVQLANHSSGLPRLPLDIFLAPGLDPKDPYFHYDEKLLFNSLKQIKPIKEPGVQYEYSNYAFGILGSILSRVYKKPFTELVKQNFITPLQMIHTTAENKVLPGQAIGYNDMGEPTAYWNFTSMATAGSIKSNAADLLNYGIQSMKDMNDKKGNPTLLATTTWDSNPNIVTLAWHRNPADQQPAIYQHGGGTYGFRSQITICPAQKWVVVCLANQGVDPGASGVATAIENFFKR